MKLILLSPPLPPPFPLPAPTFCTTQYLQCNFALQTGKQKNETPKAGRETRKFKGCGWEGEGGRPGKRSSKEFGTYVPRSTCLKFAGRGREGGEKFSIRFLEPILDCFADAIKLFATMKSRPPTDEIYGGRGRGRDAERQNGRSWIFKKSASGK